ncbi:hypothetical protein HNV11_18700 [Spirosoma taeanense]|uniref:Uncharacterized protein n=1 Tax=Spirosoma taeanense TaxID=2735870 RepID=A0A6M5YBE2_9BACT|nr:hypothetical protein [Spirosoma taeanense]QJW91259.1 hypothetical protein HNV11_18700 [Spirosoma taeanense]
MKLLFVSLLVTSLVITAVHAQQFLPEMEFLSMQKPGYLITKDGQRLTVILEKIRRKKGAIEGLTVKTADGKSVEYNAADLQEMGFPPADAAKGIAALESVGSVYRAKNSNMNEIKRDMVNFYHEYLSDQQRDVLLQLLNPGFDNKIRVYHDPAAGQTSGVGFGPVMITGGLDKSYYIRKNNVAYRLRKGEYESKFKELYADCPALATKYPASAWRDFVRHVYDYDQACH